ncbi:actin-like ATPase domain-containing protein [Stipitochalara longipes BDJ]|nr:actin-like ATPase domain-containing protein [Stipitochalara longipes BDJ]
MSAPSGPAHRSVANIRSPASANPGAPASPHTPLRNISSTFGSPSSLRAEEDTVILELGSRYLRAGFAGDAVPKAVINFGPEEQRRAGDYSRWEVGYARGRREEKSWGETHELWRPDLRGLDLGLVGDKIDRAVRDAFIKYLLIDSRPRRMNLVLPSALPLPLLSAVLDTLFTNFQPPTISLLSAPVLTTVATGLRSAMIVDIGWAETVVTGVYEFREVQCTRSVRATKMFGEAMFKLLADDLDPTRSEQESTEKKSVTKKKNLPSLEECEEIAIRMAWCKPGKHVETRKLSRGLTPVKEEDELKVSMKSLNIGGDLDAGSMVSIPLSSIHPPRSLLLPFSKLAEPCEKALFAMGSLAEDLDDEELPLHLLVYRSLLHLPVDIRSICMSRIVFVGGGSLIPGLRKRILDEVASLIDEQKWDPVRGKAVDQYRSNPRLQRTKPRQPGPTEILEAQGVMETPTPSAALIEQEHDPIEEQLKKEAAKGKPIIESGHLRAVDSLGAWSGGSLLSQLKVPAISIVEREQWLQHGAAGASKATDTNVVAAHRQSMGPGAFKAGDRSSFTLGLWG